MLELRSVTYRYPGYRRLALDGIDLTIAAGEVVGLVGPNEGGKSTLCLVSAGLAPRAIGGELTGEVLLDGVARSDAAGAAGGGSVGIVFANPASQLSGIAGTVFEEVAVGPVNLGLPVAETIARTREVLETLEIDDLALRDPSHLSGGQTQLVAIASILATRPRLLVLDEPTAELDPEGRVSVARALRALAAAGTALLVAEHDLDLLASISARLVRVEGGRISSSAAPPPAAG